MHFVVYLLSDSVDVMAGLHFELAVCVAKVNRVTNCGDASFIHLYPSAREHKQEVEVTYIFRCFRARNIEFKRCPT